MIHEYPKFTEIDIDVKHDVQTFVGKFEPYSDFNFISIYSWNADGKPRLAWLDGNLVIKLRDYVSQDREIVSILGARNIDACLKTLLSEYDSLELVPEVVIHNIDKPSDFLIVESKENFDYIYSLSHLANLPGKLYKKKRNKTNHTRTFFGKRLKIHTSHNLVDDEKNLLLELLHSWQIQTKQTINDMENEDRAIKKLLDNWHEFKLMLTRCYIDDTLVGFSINEIINHAYSICHFEKFITIHSDVGAFLVNEVSKELVKHCDLVNWEQDLGLEGLKKSKSSYYPIKYLKKYTVSLAK